MTPRFLLLFTGLLCCVSLHAQQRIWTNLKGQTIEAEFVSQTADTVTIRRADRQSFTIGIETLSEADREWLAARAAATPAAPIVPVAAPARAGSGKGIYIAVGNGLHRLSSKDGITWGNHVFVDKPGHDQNDLKAIAAGNGACVAVGGFSKSNILTTTDGVEWKINEANFGVLSGVLFVDGRFLAFGESGRVVESKDGLKWKDVGSAPFKEQLQDEVAKLKLDGPLKSNIRAWRHSNGVFVGSGDNSFLITTRDFKKWSFPPRPEPKERLYIESDANGFVVRGDTALHHSSDGLTWTNVTPKMEESARFSTLTHDGERFIVNDRDGNGWVSANGKEWKKIPGAKFSGTIEALRPNLYYSFETYWKFTEDLRYSTDGGKTWKSAKIPAPAGVTNIIFAEGLSK